MSDSASDKSAWIVAGVTSAAVLAGLAFKGLSGETVSDAVKDIGSATVPVVGALVAARMVTRKMDAEATVLSVGEDALKRACGDIRCVGWLEGPRANSENYDPEKAGSANRYLFIRKNGSGKKAQFVPVAPLADGVVVIKIQKQALVILGIKNGETSLDDAQASILVKLRKQIEEKAKSRWKDDLCTFPEVKSRQDDVIYIDFNESAMSRRAFASAVTEITAFSFDAMKKEVEGYAPGR